jgi:hypothetical protein
VCMSVYMLICECVYVCVCVSLCANECLLFLRAWGVCPQL